MSGGIARVWYWELDYLILRALARTCDACGEVCSRTSHYWVDLDYERDLIVNCSQATT